MKNWIARPAQAGGRLLFRSAALVLGIVSLIMVAGCQSEPSPFVDVPPAGASSHQPLISAITNAVIANAVITNAVSDLTPRVPAAYVLREGDILKLSFPGSPTLNSVQQVRTDGKITLPLNGGELNVAGMTTAELQQKLMDLYASQLTSKEVTVEVQSSSFPVYVTGAVLHPGKISTDHPITALEAIMEAGGFDYTKANLKNITVIRQEKDQTKKYNLNLKQVMEGKESQPFYMKPSDIIYVPEKFTWF